MPQGLDASLLTFNVYDLGGAPLYDVTNAFFLSSAAVILLVFRSTQRTEIRSHCKLI